MRNSIKIPQGTQLKHSREMPGIRQETLTLERGDLAGSERNQQKISLLEQRETIEDSILKQIAEVLKLPVEAIQNFDEEQAVNVIASTFNDNAQVAAVINNYNPVEKIIQLHEEKMELYERMLKEKDEMMARLERLMEGK